MKAVFGFLLSIFLFLQAAVVTRAQTPRVTITPDGTTDSADIATSSSIVIENIEPTTTPKPDLTQRTEETVEPLKRILEEQILGPLFPYNPIKYAIRGAVNAGVPPNTLVLLLLLPGVAALIAAARHLVGLRGFGIFLPAALSVVFVATGPVVGIALFLVIVVVSTLARITLRKFKIKLQYLPRMAMIMHFTVLGVLAILFMAPLVPWSDFGNVSIFPVLILVLLAEDFTRVQLGKSVNVAINLTTETLILALLSYVFLNLKPVQEYVLLNPEIWILSILVIDFLLGKYVGLRFMEFWRFRKLIGN